MQAPACPNCGKPLLSVIAKSIDTDLYTLAVDADGKRQYWQDKGIDVESYDEPRCWHCRAPVRETLEQAGIEAP